MSTVAQHIKAVLDRLRSAIGTVEDPPRSNFNFIVAWYNNTVDKIGRGPWCEMTNTWAMWTGNAKSLKKGRAYTVWAAQDAVMGVNGSTWHYGTSGMRAGDQVYFDWSGPGEKNWRKVDHTGTVEKIVGNGTYYILEGNFGDKLQRMLRDDKFIVGYVRFNWPAIATEPIPPKPAPGPGTVITKPKVEKQVLAIQKLLEVKQDGFWGTATDEVAKHIRNAFRAKIGWPKKAKVSFNVKTVQRVIDTDDDGVWGPNSQKALEVFAKQFQEALGVPNDAQWGPRSDNAFLSARKRNFNKF